MFTERIRMPCTGTFAPNFNEMPSSGWIRRTSVLGSIPSAASAENTWAGLLVVRAALLDAEGLGDRDLHVVDVLAVPDRLEDAVREAQHEDVLDGLLAEVVVDAKDLVLRERALQLLVEADGAREVVAERLLDHDPRVHVLGAAALL